MEHQIQFVAHVKNLSTGYVLVSNESGTLRAQLPASVWETLLPGDFVPDEFLFSSLYRLRKPARSAGG